MTLNHTQCRRILGVTIGSNFTQFGARVVISPFVIPIATAFDSSTAQIGAVLTLLWAVFAVLQFPSGVLADRFGEQKVIAVSLLLTALGSISVALAPSLAGFAAAVLVLGIGTGLYFSVGSSLVSRTFNQSSQALGLHSAAGPMAGLGLPVAATLVANQYSWRAGVLIGGVTAVPTLLFLYLRVGPTTPADPDMSFRERLDASVLLSLLFRPTVAVTTVLGIIGMYAFQSFVTFFPTFLTVYHGVSDTVANTIFGAAFVLLAVGMPLIGRVADRVGIDLAIGGTMLVAATGFLGLVVSSSWTGLILSTVLLGSGVTWAGALQTRFMAAFPDDIQATGFGLVRTIFVFLGASGNAITGFLADTVGWQIAYGHISVLLLTGTLILVAKSTTIVRLRTT